MSVRVGINIVLLACSIPLVAVGVIWYLTTLPPSWYQPLAGDDPVVKRAGELGEMQLVEAFQLIREPNELWRIRIDEAVVNAWIAARLPDWMEGQFEARFPESVNQPQLNFVPDEIQLATWFGNTDSPSCVVAGFEPEVRDGELFLRVSSVGLGRISIPGDPMARVIQYLRSAIPEAELDQEMADQAIATMQGQQGFSSMVPLFDGRHVLIRDVVVEDGSLLLTAETQISEVSD